MTKRRILVVEDDLDTVRSLTWILRDMGHEVEYAINGYVALEIAHRFLPELVFLDLGLPGMNGFEVCRMIKGEPALKDTRVVALTAYGDDDYRQRSKEAGCEVHLVKPVDSTVLSRLLD